MNKKFLSAILFGALLASTTGTFTSCKDYDDDINGLNDRVDAIEKTLAELNARFGSLAYVKAVSFANGNLVVTDQSGASVTYAIPDKDTNTTYTLDVTSSRTNNVTTVTVTLKGSDGSTQVKTFTITDNDTITQDTKLDPTQFWMDAQGIMWYGPKDDKTKSIKTGVVVTHPTQHEKTTVDVVEYKDESGATLGWEIRVDGQPLSTKLLIQDVLPITGFEYIPEAVLAEWGERVIVFSQNSYAEKTITNNQVTTTSNTLYMSNVATPQFHVNPASATLAQLTAEGKPEILKQDINKVTRAVGTFIDWKGTKIENGVMTVSLEADPSLFTSDKDKLNEIALQFETAAKNKITTEYIGVINKPDLIDLRLTDASVKAATPGTDANHYAINKAEAIAQKALVDAVNMPDKTNSVLVQCVPYTQALAGIDLKTLVSACDIEGTVSHKFFDFTKYSDLKLTFSVEKYTVGNVSQEKYMDLNGTTFKALDFDGVKSCMGKAPMVLVTLTDSHNSNKIVAAAYIKLLIVGDAAATPEADIVLEKTATIGIGCNNPNYTWETSSELMDDIYTFSTNEELLALTKEQFHTLYTYSVTPVAGYVNVGNWDLKETVDANHNHKVTFKLQENALTAKAYTAFGVYTKVTDNNVIASITNGGMYPKNIVIKHVVTADPVNFTVSSRERVANAWNADKTVASIYCQTPGATNQAQIVGDLNSLFVGGKVLFTYSNEFDVAKYPSFKADNMDYKFVFSAKNLKAGRNLVTGVDGTQYQLALSADGTKLYAVGKDLTGTAVAAAANATNLVASLSETNNKDVTYASTVVAKNLLNIAERGTDSFFAYMDIVYANGCDLTVPVTNGEFKLAFIRPVNASSNSNKYFTDGLNQGDPANVLKLGELVTFTDWRNDASLNSFAPNHLDYYKYYGVTDIKCESLDQVETNWTGTRTTLAQAFGSDIANTIIAFAPKTVVYNGSVTAIPDFGTVTYTKTSGAEIKAYELYIPLTITYKWGTMKKTITVQVKDTK